MAAPLPTRTAVDAAAMASAGISELVNADLTMLGDDAVRQLLVDVEAMQRQLSAVSHAVFTESSDRSLNSKLGYGSTMGMLVGELRVSEHEARTRIHHARHLARLRAINGDPRPPRCPNTAAALADGAISTSHVRAILETLDDIPDRVDPGDVARAERDLAAAAKLYDPTMVRRLGIQILAHLDPDGGPGDERERRRNRGLTISQQDTKLMSTIGGQLDPMARAHFDLLMDSWARPGMNNPDDPHSPTGSYDADAVDRDLVSQCASRDLRIPAQRRHDALAAMFKYFVESGQIGTNHRGLPATVIVTMTLNELEAAAGQPVDTTPDAPETTSCPTPLPNDPWAINKGERPAPAERAPVPTASGTLLPRADALKLAEQAHPILAIFDHQGIPLHFGRTKRLAPQPQRLALIPTHRGCTYPGCTRPATWCQIHHIHEWANGGPTNINNLALACEQHHPLINTGPFGWTTYLIQKGPDTGRCAWIPPTTLDPQQKPRINRYHHPHELIHGNHPATDSDPP